MQKSAPHYSDAARDEVTLLTQIKTSDPRDEKHCVRLYDDFEHVGPNGKHVFMVFEVCGPSPCSAMPGPSSRVCAAEAQAVVKDHAPLTLWLGQA